MIIETKYCIIHIPIRAIRKYAKKYCAKMGIVCPFSSGKEIESPIRDFLLKADLDKSLSQLVESGNKKVERLLPIKIRFGYKLYIYSSQKEIDATAGFFQHEYIAFTYQWAVLMAIRGQDSKLMNAFKITVGHEISHKINDIPAHRLLLAKTMYIARSNEIYNDYWGAKFFGDGTSQSLIDYVKFNAEENGVVIDETKSLEPLHRHRLVNSIELILQGILTFPLFVLNLALSIFLCKEHPTPEERLTYAKEWHAFDDSLQDVMQDEAFGREQGILKKYCFINRENIILEGNNKHENINQENNTICI